MTATLLRTSERSTFKMCRQRWWWAYVDNYISDYASPALRFGDLAHRSLAAYYRPGKRRGPRPALTFEKLYQAESPGFRIRDEEETWVDALELGIAVLDHYVREYGRDEDIEIIAPEMPFKVKLRDIGGSPFWYVGRFDALGFDLSLGEFFIFEHKTAASISTRHLPLDEQAGSYWAFAPEWVTYLIKEGLVRGKARGVLDLDYILYNFLRKAKPDPRPKDPAGHFLNKDGSISKSQPPPYFQRERVFRSEDDRRSVIRRVRQEAWEMRMVREGKLPVYKNPSTGYPDRHCETCPFYEICELHETKSDWRAVAEMSYVIGDPYEEYRADLGL